MEDAGDSGAGAAEPPPLVADRDAALKNTRHNLGVNIYDAFGASGLRHETPAADRGSDLERQLIQKDYWGMPQNLSLPAPSSSDDEADTATPSGARTKARRAPGNRRWIPATFSTAWRQGSTTTRARRRRVPIATGSPRRRSTRPPTPELVRDDQVTDPIQVLGQEDFEEFFGISESSEGATSARTAKRKGDEAR